MFSEINAYITGDIDEGLLIVTGKLMKETSIEDAENAINNELSQIIEGNITDYEIEKVKNKFESVFQFGQQNILNKAMDLAYYELLGDADKINDEVKNYRQVTKEEIKRVASKIFNNNNSSTLYYLSKELNHDVK